MNYEIKLTKSAQEQLDAIKGKDYAGIAQSISSLGEKPRPAKVKKLAKSALWRIRVGRYRVVYSIDDKAGVVIVVREARRREDTYKGL